MIDNSYSLGPQHPQHVAQNCLFNSSPGDPLPLPGRCGCLRTPTHIHMIKFFQNPINDLHQLIAFKIFHKFHFFKNPLRTLRVLPAFAAHMLGLKVCTHYTRLNTSLFYDFLCN